MAKMNIIQKTTMFVSIILLLFVAISVNVYAEVEEYPQGTIFATSITYFGGDLGGISGGDSKCQERADAASLAGTWIAMLSDSTIDLKDRIPDTRYKRTDGAVIATSKADLFDGSINVPIKWDEFGNEILNFPGQQGNLWTGTNTDGTVVPDEHCHDWTSNDLFSSGASGNVFYQDHKWIYGSNGGCGGNSPRLYCIRTDETEQMFPDQLVTGGKDNLIKVWDIDTWTNTDNIFNPGLMEGHGLSITSDGTLMAATRNSAIVIYDTHDWSEVEILDDHAPGASYSVAFSPNDTYLASAGSDNTVRIWRWDNGWQLTQTLYFNSRAFEVAWSPSGELLAVGVENEPIHVFGTNTWTPIMLPKTYVLSLDFSPDGDFLAAGGSNNFDIEVWETLNWQHVQTLTGHTSAVNALDFNYDGKLASGSWDTNVKIWTPAFTGWTNTHTITDHTDFVFDVKFSQDGRMLATGSSDKTTKVWETADWNIITTLVQENPWYNKTSGVRSVAWKPFVPTPTVEKIAFASSKNGNYDIWAINPDGTNPQQITSDSADEAMPSISPDGEKIAYTRSSPGIGFDIWTMNIDGTNQQQITSFGTASNASWSPDGTKIAFSAVTYGDSGLSYDIWVINADGTNHQQITSFSGFEAEPTWSPDGTKIAFGRGDIIKGIWAINVDGTGLYQVTNGYDSGPSWSSDGTKIAFHRWTAGGSNYDIWMVNPDGTNPQQITSGPAYDFGPDWSPDNTKLAFYELANNYDIWIVNKDGSGRTRVTTDPAYEYGPSWHFFDYN